MSAAGTYEGIVGDATYADKLGIPYPKPVEGQTADEAASPYFHREVEKQGPSNW